MTDRKAYKISIIRMWGWPLALFKDNSYCVRSDAYKLLHPRTVYDDLHVFRDYAGPDLARAIMRTEMYDTIPGF